MKTLLSEGERLQQCRQECRDTGAPILKVAAAAGRAKKDRRGWAVCSWRATHWALLLVQASPLLKTLLCFLFTSVEPRVASFASILEMNKVSKIRKILNRKLDLLVSVTVHPFILTPVKAQTIYTCFKWIGHKTVMKSGAYDKALFFSAFLGEWVQYRWSFLSAHWQTLSVRCKSGLWSTPVESAVEMSWHIVL